jgi:formate-dependent nitrite reductase membrane component NrfD
MNNPYNPPSANIEKLGNTGENERMKRPTSVSVIAWYLIVVSAISLVSIPISLNNPMARELMAMNPIPIPLQIVQACAGILITIVSGIALLKGRSWARLLFIGWSSVGFVITILTSPMKAAVIPGIVILAIIAFFLFRPKANEYFSAKETADSAKGV